MHCNNFNVFKIYTPNLCSALKIRSSSSQQMTINSPADSLENNNNYGELNTISITLPIIIYRCSQENYTQYCMEFGPCIIHVDCSPL